MRALSPRWSKWFINLFPPLLFNRIVVQDVSEDFTQVKVKIVHSFMNRNLQGTIFGGTLFSAADPFFSLMYYQVFAHRHIPAEAWVKRLEIDYIRPANQNVYLNFNISQQELDEATEAISLHHKFEKIHHVEIVTKTGEVCCRVKIWVYLKRRRQRS